MTYLECHNTFSKYSGKHAWANIVEPDQPPQNAASYQSPHCLSLIRNTLDISPVSFGLLELLCNDTWNMWGILCRLPAKGRKWTDELV